MARPARLPDEAPASLRAFVACRTMSVELELGELPWVPAPPGSPVDFTPAVEVLPGWTPTTATVRVGYGPNDLISIELPIAIVGGRLSIDTGRLPSDVERPVITWMTRFNETLTDNDKELDELRLSGSRLMVTKRSVAPASTAGGAMAPPVAALAGPRSTERPARHVAGRVSRRTVSIAAAILAVLTLGGLGWALASRGDGSRSLPATDTLATTTTAAPASATGTIMSLPEAVTDPDSNDTPGPDAGGVVCGELEGEALDLRELSPCDRIPDDEYMSCTGLSECSVGRSPTFVAFGNPSGTDHGRSVADADTGDSGASLKSFGLVVMPPGGIEGWSARVQSDCSGTVLTGSNPVLFGLTVVEQPLEFFGPCQVVETSITNGTTTLTFPPEVWGDEGNYVVAAAESPPGEPDGLDELTIFSEGFELADTWADAAFTVQNSLARGLDVDRCAWFVTEREAPLLGTPTVCEGGTGSWVFSAAQHEPGIADSVDALGVPATDAIAVGAAMLRGAAHELDGFGWTSDYAFPCGPGYIGYTVCPGVEPDSPTSPMVMVQVLLDDAIPLESTVERSVAVDFGDENGSAWRVSFADETWGLDRADGMPTAARAILRGNSITVLVPQSELPSPQVPGHRFVLTTSVGEFTTRQPSMPVSGVLVLPYDPEIDGNLDPDAVAEPIEEFYEQLSASVSSGDLGFSLDRLHPVVFDAYSEPSCREALASFADPDLVIEFISEGDTEPWVWEIGDGQSYEVDNATTVTISLTGRGQAGEPTESHVADIDGRLHWFTFCE